MHRTAQTSNGNARVAAAPGTWLDPQETAEVLGHLWDSPVPAGCEIECLRSDRSLPALQVTVCPHMYLYPQLPKSYGAQSEIYIPGAAFNSFAIFFRSSEDLREDFLLLASSFDLRGPEQNVQNIQS